VEAEGQFIVGLVFIAELITVLMNKCLRVPALLPFEQTQNRGFVRVQTQSKIGDNIFVLGPIALIFFGTVKWVKWAEVRGEVVETCVCRQFSQTGQERQKELVLKLSEI
jgi:hypothetical protein